MNSVLDYKNDTNELKKRKMIKQVTISVKSKFFHHFSFGLYLSICIFCKIKKCDGIKLDVNLNKQYLLYYRIRL